VLSSSRNISPHSSSNIVVPLEPQHGIVGGGLRLEIELRSHRGANRGRTWDCEFVNVHAALPIDKTQEGCGSLKFDRVLSELTIRLPHREGLVKVA
jgi:hypothetical protein